MMMTVSGVRARLELEPNVSVMKCAQGTRLCALMMRALSGCTCECAQCAVPRKR